MNFLSYDLIPYLILILTLTFGGSLFLLLSSLYKNKAEIKFFASLKSIFSDSKYANAIILLFIVISFVTYLLYPNQILLLSTMGFSGCFFAIIVNLIINSLNKRINLNGQENYLQSLLLKLSLYTLSSLLIIGLFTILFINLKVKLLDGSYALITFSSLNLIALFYKKQDSNLVTSKNLILSNGLYILASTVLFPLTFKLYPDNQAYLVFILVFITLTLLSLLIMYLLNDYTLKKSKEDKKEYNIRILNYSYFILVGVIFLFLSFYYFGKASGIKLGGFDLGLVIFLAIILNLVLTSIIDAIDLEKSVSLYLHVLVLIITSSFVILLDYIAPSWGLAFVSLVLLLFSPFKVLLTTKNEINLDLAMSFMLVSLNLIYYQFGLFRFATGSTLSTILSLNHLIPSILGIGLALFINTNFKSQNKYFKWILSYLLLTSILLVLVNSLFGLSGVISLSITYCLVYVLANGQDENIYDRIYLTSIFLASSTLLLEVFYFFNLGVGLI